MREIMSSVSSGVYPRELIEFFPGKLYFAAAMYHKQMIPNDLDYYYFVDADVHYGSFFLDFGPLNLSVLFRFCQKITQFLKTLSKRIIVYCSNGNESLVNAAYLMGAYGIINLGMTAELAYLNLHKAAPDGFIAFRDASMGPPSYKLHLHNVLRGVEKAVKFNWICFDTFDPEEYEYYEKVENGDLNWIIPNKVLSFCGPHKESIVENGYPYHAPEVYFDYFRTHNITTVIRLNKRMYDAKRFTDAGFDHVDLFFVDGSTPSDEIVERFINVVDSATGAVAVHCKAGLGRTGTLIACWMMKEFGITAAECMAWLRICRPGSVIGPQQQFLIAKQPWCWALGTRSASSHLSALTAKVNEICIRDTKGMKLRRPKSLKGIGKTTEESNEPTEEASQGDHLLAQKAKAQHATPNARFTSPTTPIKPLNNSSKNGAWRTGGSNNNSTQPISRVTVTSSSSVKSKSEKRLTTWRSRPYPSVGVKVSLSPSVYELRPRKKFNADQLKDASKNLPPNSAALIGVWFHSH